MSSTWQKRIWPKYLAWFWVIVICWVHSRYFFPLAAHRNLRFQVIGESVELLGVGTMMVAAWAFSKRKGVAAKISPVQAAMFGICAAAVLMFAGWRDFFPNDQFSAAAFRHVAVEDGVTGILVGSFSLVFQGKKGRPSVEDERSVV